MRDRAQALLAPLGLVVYATAASLGALTGGLWAALGIGMAVVLFITVATIDRKIPLPAKQWTLLVAATLAVLAAELPLSAHPEISQHVWLQLASIFVPLLFLTQPRLQRAVMSNNFTPVVTLAAVLGCCALGLELQSGGAFLHMLKKPDAALTEYNRGMAHLAILAFPLFAGLWVAGGRLSAVALALLLLFPASLTESHTAKLALIAGMLCAAVAFYRPRGVRNALAALAVFLLGWPFYAQALFTAHRDAIEQWHPSWRHRMEIWDALSYRIADKPLLGWGLGTTHTLDFHQPHGDWYQVLLAAGAPHAHNFITELWVETGLAGIILAFTFLMLSLRAAMRLHVSLRPFALGGWLAALTVSMFGFDFWTDSLWAAFALAAFAFGMIDQRIKGGNHIADIQFFQR